MEVAKLKGDDANVVSPISLTDTTEKKKRKSYATKAQLNLPMQRVVDGRRTYSQLLLNTFNSCDITKLKSVLDRYCVDNLYSVCLYDGTNNPYAPPSTELRGKEGHVDLWTALFKSAPDFLFVGEFLEAYIDPRSKLCVVRSKFTFSGTRVVDIKIANEINNQVLEEKLKKKEQFTTDESELMAQIHAQLAASYSPQSTDDPDADFEAEHDMLDDSVLDGRHFIDQLPGADACATAEAAAASNAQDTSIFKTAGKGVNLEGAKMYADSTPLAQSLTMNCSGTLTVFLNESHKIIKYEFLYVAMDVV